MMRRRAGVVTGHLSQIAIRDAAAGREEPEDKDNVID